MVALSSILKVRYPHNLQELRLSNLKLSPTCLTKLFESLKDNALLQKIKLTRINIEKSSHFPLLLNFIQTNYNLIDLDLSWAGLDPRKITMLWKILASNNHL